MQPNGQVVYYTDMPKLIKQFTDSLERGRRFVTHDVWHIGLPGEEVPHGLIIKQVRAIILLVRSISDETLMLRASALTVATLIFIVPFLAFLFYFVQTFNLGDQIYKTIWSKFELQLAQVITLVQGQEVTPDTPISPPPSLEEQIITTLFPIFSTRNGLAGEFAGQNPVALIVNLAAQSAANPKAISVASALFILSTVFGFMRNVELAFNRIWGVRRKRHPFRTITDYFLITITLPFVVLVVLGINAALESEILRQQLSAFSNGLRGVQFFTVCLSFSVLYWGIPNARVRFHYALIGGLVAGALWILSSYMYVKFQFGLVRYTLFFSTFALFPLLLMWIFISWLILLFGAVVTFAYQNEKTFAMERLAENASYAYREALAVRTAMEMARRFAAGQPGLSIKEAADAWNVPVRLLNETFDCLMAAGLAVECATEPVTYYPGRSPHTTQVMDVLRALRENGQDPSLLRHDSSYKPLYQSLDGADQATLSSSVAEVSQQMMIMRNEEIPAVASKHETIQPL